MPTDERTRRVPRPQGTSDARTTAEEYGRDEATGGDDGVPLDRSRLLGRVGLDGFLALAEELAGLLAAVHRQGVIVNALRPDTIRVRAGTPRLAIADFSSATTFAEEHGGFDVIGDTVAAAAYASPEQSGRMNRPVDYRTDLYSLGATLYALATGGPPFREPTAVGTVHAHLARAPRSPREDAPWLPTRVADIILQLLAKEPDERYQSAAGVADDLARLRQAIRDGRSLEDVRLRERDITLLLRPSRRLRGRAAQTAIIESAFESVAHGDTVRLFVAGRSGVGKTALINELQRSVTLRRGVFAAGKFEQFQTQRPFVALSQCLRHLTHLLLAESRPELEDLRRRLATALGCHAGALVEVAPELRSLLGDVGTPPDATPAEAHGRLRTLFVRFVREIATPQRPLVLVLDDLQWADQPSLDLLAALLAEAALPGLLVIGAYRDDEVDHSHPLAVLLRQPTPAGGPQTVITLEGLPAVDLEAFLADTLHVSVADVRPLADIAMDAGGGNPLFTMTLLDAWHREGALWPDADRGRWRWDEARIAATRRDDRSVVEWLRADLTGLPADTADALATAACLGAECTLGALAIATDVRPPELVAVLTPALERGMLVTSTAVAFRRAEPDAGLGFRHDGMQQAAYQLDAPAARRRRHLDIARRFHAAAAAGDARFARQATEQYAEARDLIQSPAERDIARRLFLDAARLARRAGAFAVAERYLRSGIGLLPPDAWSAARDEAWEFFVDVHVVCYSQGKHGEADAAYRTLADHAAGPARLVDAACVQVMSLSNRTRYADAVRLGCELLEALGVRVPHDDPLPGLERELEALEAHVAAGRLDALPTTVAGPDADRDGAAKLMNRMIPAAFFLDPLVACWMAVHCGRQWIEDGYRPAYVYPMACVMLATVGRRDDHATGYRAATQALAAAAAAGEHGVEMARARHVFGLFSCHWFEPLEEAIGHARQAFDGLILAGELEFACYTFFTSQAALLDTCGRLDDLRPETTAALAFAAKTGNRHAEPAYLAYRQFIRALEGRTDAPGSFTDAEFDEAGHLAREAGNPMARCYFHLHRALAACIFADDDALLAHAEAAAALSSFITGFYPAALVALVEALALALRLRRGADRSTIEPRLTAIRAWLAARAADAPMNFAHLVDFLEATTHDACGRPHEAFVCFERSLRRAGVARRHWHQALITEHAGRCFLRHGLDHAGRLLLSEAHARFHAFGAHGKVAALERELPFVRVASGDPAAAARRGFDEQAIVGAARAMASERSVPRLVARVVEVVGHLTGATDVRILALDVEERWILKGGTRGGVPLDRMLAEDAVTQGLVAGSVLHLGLATLDPIVSEDAVLDGRFRGDPYFAGMGRCSLLAIPVLLQGRPKAFVIVENRLFHDAFTPRHVATIAAICGQLAVCIENVRMYESLELKVAERTREAEEARARERVSEERQRRELESKLKTSLSAAAVAHEINLPLSNVLLGARLALEALDGPTPDVEALRTVLAGLVDQSHRVVTTIEKMRMLLRNVQTALVPVDLVAIVRTAVLFTRPVLDDHGVTFRLEAPAGHCLVRGDAVQLQAAIGNLLRNAAEAAATRPQGARRVTVDVRYEGNGDAEAVCVVGDSGPGFPVDRPEGPLETTKPQGTGLGLYVVRNTIDNHGGRVVIGRSPLGGAEVRIVLPCLTRATPGD